jgi:aspartyl protease family protein
MKRIVFVLLCLAGVTALPSFTQAQEVDGCFALDSKGRAVRLSNICPESPKQEKKKKSFRHKVREEEEGVFYLPIEYRVHGIPVVKVLFNGEHEFEMFFDTGASSIVITPQILEALGLEPIGITMTNTASDRAVPSAIFDLNLVEAGGVAKKNIVARVSDALDIGLLGQDFYRHYDISIRRDVIELRSR